MLNQTQINMAFGCMPEKALNYINFLGENLDYDLVSNSIVNHSNGFRIANLARVDIAQDILGAFRKASAEGKSDNWFVEHLAPTLKAKGWWNTEEVIDPKTGEVLDEVIDYGLGSPARLKLIYENLSNTMCLVMHYIRMRNVAQLYPYWRYHAVMDSHVRDEHAKLHNKVFRCDDPIWQIIYPPNGHRCRCSIENLTEDEVKQLGIKVLSSQGFVHKDGQTGISFIDENGQTIEFFPDKGFDYNPATSYYDVDLSRYDLELARSYVNAELSGEPLETMYNDAINAKASNDSVTAAVLSDDEMTQFNIESKAIKLEQSTLLAQMQNKTLLPLDSLRQLQTAIINAPVVLNYQGAICFCEYSGVSWRLIGVGTNGDIRVIADLTDEAFQMIVEHSLIIRGQV